MSLDAIDICNDLDTLMPWNWMDQMVQRCSEHRTLTVPGRWPAGEAFETDGRVDKDVEAKETPKKRQCKEGQRQSTWHWREGKFGACRKTETWLLVKPGRGFVQFLCLYSWHACVNRDDPELLQQFGVSQSVMTPNKHTHTHNYTPDPSHMDHHMVHDWGVPSGTIYPLVI